MKFFDDFETLFSRSLNKRKEIRQTMRQIIDIRVLEKKSLIFSKKNKNSLKTICFAIIPVFNWTSPQSHWEWYPISDGTHIDINDCIPIKHNKLFYLFLNIKYHIHCTCLLVSDSGFRSGTLTNAFWHQ